LRLYVEQQYRPSFVFRLTSVRSTPKTFVALLLVVFAPAIIMAQQKSPPQATPKVSVRTELVLVPVVVLRHRSPLRQVLVTQGELDEHVAGLSKTDFETSASVSVVSLRRFRNRLDV
jgi:hypothetical protein